MDFVSYINLYVHVVLLDNFFWIGKIVDADEQGFNLIDRNGKKVFINNKSVSTIREVSNGR